MEYKDYYKILGVERSATEAQIKSAYRKLARKFHPDVNKASDAARKFKDINEAYEVLSDKEKRRRYDSLGANWQAGSNFTPPPGFNGSGFNQGAYSQGFDDLGGFSDFFSSIFGDFAGRQSSQRQSGSRFSYDNFSGFSGGGQQTKSRTRTAPAEPAEDLDMTQDLFVTAKDLMTDKPLNVKMNTFEKCTQCNGVGSFCYNCGGAGVVSKTKTLNVKLPKGVKEGQKIRLSNEGKSGKHGKKGDLYFVIKFKDHEYAISDEDLTKQIEITPPEAVLGTKKDIKTLHGPISIKIPPMTHSGKILRLKDLGLPKTSGGYGNLNVKININIPQKLSEQEIELYKKLSNLD